MKALVSGVLLLMFVVTATCAEAANEQPNPAEFDDGPLRNPRRQLLEDEGSAPSSNPAEFDDGPLRNPRRLLPEGGGNGPSSNPAEFDDGPLRNPRRALPEGGGNGAPFLGEKKQNADDQNHAVEPGRSAPMGGGKEGPNGGREDGPSQINPSETPSRDEEPFIIIKEGEHCSVLRVFDVTRDRLRFQIGRISYASREGAENDAKSLCEGHR